MADLKIEIFAYKWFRLLIDSNTLTRECAATEAYKDECLAYPECVEASNCDNLYSAIIFRSLLFQKLHLEEIATHIKEFQNSRTDFHCYVLRTCHRVDLFGNLSIFDRVFATSAFVFSLCQYCLVEFSNVMSCGYICWAMYFDEFIDEFYKQGGWNRLKSVAASYKRPSEFLWIANSECKKMDIVLIKIRKAVESHFRFKMYGEIGLHESISLSWVKFYTKHMNRNSDNDFDQLTKESYSNELKSYSEMENLLKDVKYFCDPNGSEVVNAARRICSNGSLETPTANLNICNKHASLQSEADTILEPKSEQETTIINSAENIEEKNVLAGKKPDKSVPNSCNISSEQNCLVQTEHISEGDPIKIESFQLQSQAQSVKTTIVQNLLEKMTISNCNGKKMLKKNKFLATTPLTGKDTQEDNDSYETRKEQNGLEMKKGTNKITTFTRQTFIAENGKKQNSSKTQNDTRKEDEWEAIKGAKSPNLISFAKKNAEKGKNYETRDEPMEDLKERNGSKSLSILTDETNGERKSDRIKCDTREENKDKNKRKKKNNILMRGMLSEGKEDEEKTKEINDSIRKEQEDDDIKNFLRMCLVLGDKQGISYVKKTSQFPNIKSNA